MNSAMMEALLQMFRLQVHVVKKQQEVENGYAQTQV